jgi:hypothetical protein
MTEWQMNDELKSHVEGSGNDVTKVVFRNLLKGMRKATRNLSKILA